MGTKYLIVLFVVLNFVGCIDNKQPVKQQNDVAEAIEPQEHYEFGFKLDDFTVKRDTIRPGDSFGEILEHNRVGYPAIFNIANKAKDSFDIRKLQVGKPYTLLCSKDTTHAAKCFIYQPNKEDYVVINFKDSVVKAYTSKKPIKYVEKTATGIINSNISQTLESQGLSQRLAHIMADEIYAWTIDFRHLQKGDRFKVLYTDKYIEDTIYAGVHEVKAAVFEHNKEPFYAFQFETDSTKGIVDYFADDAKNLRRAFLKAPVKFKRISSRYNLRRRIAAYGYKIKPHRGTDFAAAIGTPIMATANGTVSKSAYKGNNGNYVKIRHNATYSTQYLHMKKRNVKVGQFVKQGDVIGWVGMTGKTGGPHVCYRFWKNGKEVDPFKQKLPEAEPISDSLKIKYLDHIKPIKAKLDAINYKEDSQNLLIDANQITMKN